MPPPKRRNLYATLGVHRYASELEIRAAYRRRALEKHPDKGGSHEAFLALINAFEVLSDPRVREDYDRDLEKRGERDGLGRLKRVIDERPLQPPAPPNPQREVEVSPPQAEEFGPFAPAPGPRQEQREAQAKVGSKRARQAGTTRHRPEHSEAQASTAAGPQEAQEVQSVWRQLLEAEAETEFPAILKGRSWRFLGAVAGEGHDFLRRRAWLQKVPKPPKKKMPVQKKASKTAGRKVGLQSLMDASKKDSLGEKACQHMQKHIRKVGPRSFNLVMCFDWLEVASSSTHLVEAIDWHIILMKFQRLAKEIFSQGHADDYPLVSETLQSILDEHTQQGGRAPTLTFALRMYFRNGEKHKLFRFFRTTDLRWVLHCRTRIKALMPTCDHDVFLRAVRGMCQKSIEMSGEAHKKHYDKIRADNAAMKAARKLQAKNNAKLHARAQAAVQFLAQARKKFKAGKDMQDLDAVFCDFGMGEELCFFAIVQAQGSGHSAGPLRETWQKAAKDLQALKKIQKSKGFAAAMAEAQRLDEDEMLR
ncbi:DNAJ1, partial [Symbiodinium necroappetens]